MGLERRLRALEKTSRPTQGLKVIFLDGLFGVNSDPDSPEHREKIEEAKRKAGLESYDGPLLTVSFVSPGESVEK